MLITFKIKTLIIKMKGVLKYLMIPLFLFAFFLYGVYIGTVNNNYIHDKKRLLLNCKIIVSNYFEQINSNVENINIKLSKPNRKSLHDQIEKAIQSKTINKDSTKWLKAKISVNKTESAGKIKIKGMFLDEFEWKENCFSFSVKLKETKFRELSQFYLHYPKKRLLLNEWYGDILLRKLNLINHKNYFVTLSINNEDKGLYLIEEKYNKSLLTNNKREEGPIVYFSKKHLRDHNYDYSESYNNASINFQYSHNKNQRAKELLEGYRTGDLSPDQVFNFEKTATLFALTELVGYVHHLQFHNIKFYYNSKEDLLEPIANDFQFADIKKWTEETLFLAGIKRNNNYIDFPWAEKLYQNQKFLFLLIQKLKKISNPEFLEHIFKDISEEEGEAKIKISIFDPLYLPDIKEKIIKNSQQINFILNNPADLELFISLKDSSLIYRSKSYLPIIPMSIYNSSDIVYRFDKNTLLKAKNFGELPKNDTIHLDKIIVQEPIKALKFNYKILGDTTELHHDLQVLY